MPPVRGTPTPVKRLLEPPPSCLTAKLAAERKFQRLNHCAKNHQPQPSLSAQPKITCQEGLWKYAPIHALQPHCLRRRQRLERGGGGSWSLVSSPQAARGRDARRRPRTRARPAARAVGESARAAVPRGSVSAAPPHSATVASLLLPSLARSRRLRERREICLI